MNAHEPSTALIQQLVEPFRSVLLDLERSGLPFAVGGGVAYSLYTDFFRQTHDLDLYVLPDDRSAAIAIVTHAGYGDYHDRAPYQRHWIFRGWQDGRILDLIWQMPNERASTDELWFKRARTVTLADHRLKIIPPEELIFAKLFVLQRDRCDWPDLLSIIHVQGRTLNWEHLLWRLGEDVRVLSGLLCMFGWLCPDMARAFPDWLWPRLGLAPPRPGPPCEIDDRRVRLLDTRGWFAPLERGRKDEIRSPKSE